MNGNQLTAYAMTPTPTEAHLIRELNQYCVMPSRCHDGSETDYCVYYWLTAMKVFKYIGRRSTYHAADLLIRKHIRRRWRRRVKQNTPLILRLCPNCGLRRRYFDAYGDCAKCVAAALTPDDDPGFDPMFLM